MRHHQKAEKPETNGIVPQNGSMLNEKKQVLPTVTYNYGKMAADSNGVDSSSANPTNPTGNSNTNQRLNYVVRGQEHSSITGLTTSNGDDKGGNGHPVSSNEPSRKLYNMYECQMAQLTVYLDRALICRRIRPQFNASEITEVLFEHLSPAIDKDSIRVEIRGAATILDVTCTAKSLGNDEDSWLQSLNELQTELRQCKRHADNLISRISRTEKQRSVLETFANSLSRKEDELVINNLQSGISPFNHVNELPNNLQSANVPALVPSADNKNFIDSVNPYDPKNIESLHRFLNIYKEEAERLDCALLDAIEELEQTRIRIESLEKEIREVELKQNDHLARELSVLIEPRETGQVEILITYLVTRCGWKPAYDIRLLNSTGTMKIVYYGIVQQATGEDWEPRYMTLSTAQPSLGGTIPHLGLQRVYFRRDQSPAMPIRNNANMQTNVHVPPTNSKSRTASKISGFRRANRSIASSFHESDRTINEVESEALTPTGTLKHGATMDTAYSTKLRNNLCGRSLSRRTLDACINSRSSSNSTLAMRMSTLGSQSPQSTVSTIGPAPPIGTIATVQLEVPRPPNLIRCDNEPNRVTVGLLDIQPRYEYVTVPKRALNAYLKATAVNNTDFLILAGSTNIYADSTFIGKSKLNSVAPGEEFCCHLGAENGIKVVYRPLYKYRETTGSGNKNTLMTFKQIIEIKNTFNRRIRLMVIDQVPVSGEEKIKVSLLEPTIKHPEKYDRNKPIRMNKSNNVEWDLDLGPDESRELTLKYSVEYPVNEDLDVCVTEPPE